MRSIADLTEEEYEYYVVPGLQASEEWRRRYLELQQTLFWVVRAAGGRVDIPHRYMVEGEKDWEMESWHDPRRYATTFTVKRKEG